jgi:hypothetical protein
MQALHFDEKYILILERGMVLRYLDMEQKIDNRWCWPWICFSPDLVARPKRTTPGLSSPASIYSGLPRRMKYRRNEFWTIIICRPKGYVLHCLVFVPLAVKLALSRSFVSLTQTKTTRSFFLQLLSI